MKLATGRTARQLDRALAAHFDPSRGTPYWLARERELGIDARRDVRGEAGLALFGAFDVEALRTRPLEHFVPRSIWSDRADLVLSETGGTTGRPLRSVFLPAELDEAFGKPFALASEARGFPRGAGWLFAGPSGPHVIGQAARLLARRSGSLEPFAVDLDPRWARAQAPGSLGERLYREHVADQALDVLARERIGVLFTTPPIALELARAMPAAERRRIRGVHLGGLPLSSEDYLAIRAAFDGAVVMPGYGNSLLGLLVEPAEPLRRPDGGLELDYFPLPGRLVVRVVAEEGGAVHLDRPVAPGETGRVVLSRLDESFLLPNLVERDRATLVEAGPAARALGLAPLGLRNPHPAGAGETSGGLY